MDWKDASAKLAQPLDPKNVKPRKANGPKGDYIEGWHAIAEANRIFGFGSWSYEVKGLTKDSVAEGKNGRGDDQWQAAYTAIVRVTVGEVVREDVGFGSGFAKQIGDAIEGATKEAVTDALKRCLRTFGDPFGLALYDKDKANVRPPEPDPKPVADDMLATIADRSADRLAGLTAHKKFEGDLGWLRGVAPDLAKQVQDAIDAKLNTQQGEAA